MLIGVPKEIKNHEYRVGMTPLSVREAVRHGHKLWVQSGAGLGIGASDEDYKAAGAQIIPTAEEIFAKAEMIVKVKEPQAGERKMLRDGQILYTYLHLAPDPEQTKDLIASGAVCIAYETVTNSRGGLPLLAPMSQVAGRMSIQSGAHCLEKAQGGSGILLGGVPGVAPAKVVILGGGVVGTNAAAMALGLGADVTVLEKSTDRMEELVARFGTQLKTLYSTQGAIEDECATADLIVGGVLIPGAAAPKLVTRKMLKNWKNGSVLVDVAIDQGGCAETSKPTTHADPTYVVDGVIHYCVANMPGGVARTSTYALNNVTLPFGLAIANKGYKQALLEDHHLRAGLNVCKGKVTYKAVADDLGYEYVPAEKALAA
ncbi:alanine dehydrogenase [Nordella sp. HKS 07]|uniref:alanine dehydrogenase n=1 Tax=Nordella sp. HKS 07 TaxID=2712222 RepID=UPI0013E1C897|nr:alanine dehydrogenase [Nordella sp. HKS 07]QIG50216.1 alanine dehydrogenase [Nordella sp. HKS 07]